MLVRIQATRGSRQTTSELTNHIKMPTIENQILSDKFLKEETQTCK